MRGERDDPRWNRTRVIVAVARVGILGVLLAGAANRSPSVVVNAVVAFGVTYLPAVLERRTDTHLEPGAVLWIAAAVFLHAYGMLGAYGSVWWWDHLTHTLSATVVASVGYVAARAIERRTATLRLPGAAMGLYVLLFTLAAGVAWEVLEFAARTLGALLGREPLLRMYGVGDTVLDLVFDAVGALVAAVLGRDTLESAVLDDGRS